MAWAKSYHEHTPALVTGRSRRRRLHQVAQRDRQIPRVRRRAPLIVDDADFVLALQQTCHGCGRSCAWAEEPAGAHDAAAVGEDVLLGGALRLAVDVERCGWIVLAVGPPELAIEDVVGAESTETGVAAVCCPRHVQGRLGVVAPRTRRVALAAVDVGPGRAVHEALGGARGDPGLRAGRVAQVTVVAAQRHHVVRAAQRLDDGPPQHPRGAGDDDPQAHVRRTGPQAARLAHGAPHTSWISLLSPTMNL
jgi:hypothetical protein